MRRIEEIDVNYVEMWDELNKKNEEFEKAIGMLRAGYNLSNKHLISIDDLEVGVIKLIFRIIKWIILKIIYLKIRRKHGKVSIN